MTGFKAHTLGEHTRALAQYLPSGISAKINPSSNLYKLLEGLGGELTRIDELFEDTFKQLDILTCDNVEYMSLWEALVGLPDDVFPKTDSLTIVERRDQVLLKLRGLGALTEQDFIDLAKLLGIDIKIEHGTDFGFPYTFPIIFTGNERESRFVMVVNLPEEFDIGEKFPLTFPFTLSGENSNALEALFNKLKPATTIIIFNYI
jgi:uncharacterized protein YmfQ (DUF2313 family)